MVGGLFSAPGEVSAARLQGKEQCAGWSLSTGVSCQQPWRSHPVPQLVFFYFYYCFETVSQSVGLACLEVTAILLPQLPRC